VRSCTYTDDLNRVFERFLAGEESGLFHAGGPRPITLYQIAQGVNRADGYDPALPSIQSDPQQARKLLTQAGLRVGAIRHENSNTTLSGQLIDTSPAAGQSVPVGSNVTLVVSSGPAKVNVPDVTGESEALAKSDLHAAGFEVTAVIPRFLPYSFRGRIPASAALARIYLRVPLFWRVLGKQFLVLGVKGRED